MKTSDIKNYLSKSENMVTVTNRGTNAMLPSKHINHQFTNAHFVISQVLLFDHSDHQLTNFNKSGT